MSDRSVPNPMPPTLRDNVNVHMSSGGDLESLTKDQRALVRRLVATGYAVGHSDGEVNQIVNALTDREAPR